MAARLERRALIGVEAILAVVAGWLALGVAGLFALQRFWFVARVLFPAGGALALALAGISAAGLSASPESVVLPIGLPGIFIAAVLAAAMSSIAAELNSLSTTTVIDFYRRWVKPTGSDAHFLFVSKLATGFWGLFACVVATYAVALGSLIEVVNRFGSFFYGSILGVFLLAMVPWARGWGAFIGLIAGMTVVGFVNFGTGVAYLWQNVIGAVVVLAVGMLLAPLGGPGGSGGAVAGDPGAMEARTGRAHALGFVGGLFAAAGGGWGPIVTANLMSAGIAPAVAVGSSIVAEFFVTIVHVVIFAGIGGLRPEVAMVGLLVGGVVAAPLGPVIAARLPTRVMIFLVGFGVVLASASLVVR